MIEAIINNPDYFNLLLDTAMKDVPEVIILNRNNDPSKVQRNAFFVLIDIMQRCSPEQLLLMVQNGILKCFVKFLDSQDSYSIEVSLAGMDTILKCGKRFAEKGNLSENPFLKELDKENGIEGLKKLEVHPNTNIRRRACNILKIYQ